MDAIFARYEEIISRQDELIKSIAEKLSKIESIGGNGGNGYGSAVIEDYERGKEYTRNTLLVDTETETVYRVIDTYVSDTVENDNSNGHLKLVGYESQVVTFNHNPSQTEINVLPDDSLVAIYSSTDTPYLPDVT